MLNALFGLAALFNYLQVCGRGLTTPIKMGRHGKNQTASAVYSYHEKKKDTSEF